MSTLTNKRTLGKGLSAIIASSPQPVEEMEKTIIGDKNRIIAIPLSKIQPNPDQPRTHFDESKIAELAESIRSTGLIEPIIVRQVEENYYIIAGERRFRAHKLLEAPTIRAIVLEASEEESCAIALIENVQRENLDPVEEAKGYRMLISRFSLKQNDVAGKVGKSRESIANALRLLNLPDEIQNALSSGSISPGHAKVLLSIESASEQIEYAKQITEKGLSVRALELLLAEERGESTGTPGKKGKSPNAKIAQIRKMEEKLRQLLGTKVEIKHSGTRGKIEISYYSLDDFERIIEKFI